MFMHICPILIVNIYIGISIRLLDNSTVLAITVFISIANMAYCTVFPFVSMKAFHSHSHSHSHIYTQYLEYSSNTVLYYLIMVFSGSNN